MKFGAHVSSAAPFSESVNRAKAIGAECMQVFVNAPQRWNPVTIPETEIERFNELNHNPHPYPLPAQTQGEGTKETPSPRLRGEGGGEVAVRSIDPVISHTIYLISFSGLNSFYYEASKKSIIDEMEKGRKMGFLGVNTHLGSSKEKSFDEVKVAVIQGIADVLNETPNGPFFIIENSAGAGNIIGDTFEEIGEIIKGVDSPRAKVILDTAHLFESGYPIHTAQGLEETVERFDELVGMDRLVGLHLNDSITPFNSKRDRHADIGMGEIGIDAFGRIVNHPKLKNLFGIIETPSLKGKGDVDNLEILRSLENSI